MKKNLLIICFLLLAVTAQAGTGLKLIATTGTGSSETTLYIGEDEMVMKTRQGGNFTLLYDADDEQITLINHNDKSYNVLGKAELTELNAQINQMAQLIKGFYKNMPPKDQKRFYRMINGKPEGVKFISGDNTVSIDGYKTIYYKAVDNKQAMLMETNIVPFKTLGVSQEDVASVISLSRLLDKYLSGVEQMVPGASLFTDLGNTDNPVFTKGIPMKTITYDHTGAQQEELKVTSVEKVKFSLEDFKIPSDYTKKRFGMPNPMGR